MSAHNGKQPRKAEILRQGRTLLAIAATIAAPLLLSTTATAAQPSPPGVTAPVPPFGGISQVIYDSAAVTAWKGQPTGTWPGGGANPNGPTYSNPRGFYWPLTLNLYTLTTSSLSNVTKPGTYPAAGSLIASVTQTVLIPWQPTPSTSRKCLSLDRADFSPYLQA